MKIRKIHCRALRLALFGMLLFNFALPAVAEDEWPTASCDLLISTSPTWPGLLVDIGALVVAEVAVGKKKPECNGLLTTRIISKGLLVSGHCRCDGLPDCAFEGEIRGRIRVDEQPTYDWAPLANPVAEFWENDPNDEKCSLADTAMTTAWGSYKELSLHLDCWTDAYLDSNYERLDTLGEEVAAAGENLEMVYDVFLEQSLHRYGGSIPASLYVPEDSGGLLGEVAELVEAIADKTEAAGYRLNEDVVEILQAADQATEEGQFKQALQRYRLAYDKITVQSLKFEPESKR